jgi:isoleucyl-tRNA synthetase
LGERALEAVKGEIDFVPRWGQARILGMLQSRPDWCISRQRAWGLPIPVFYNEKGEALLTPQSVRAVARRFAQTGSDAWFNESPAQLLGDFDPGPEFPRDKLRKEKDIFDVWFESGSSWRDVLEGRENLHFPADLYLEGSDQHRGWFQLSLLLALGATGQAPFKQVLTHGFVVKPDGTKVSKSDKECVTATAEVNRHGADLLRLWCCSVDYQNDIPASPAAIQEFSDKYRKIRNTLRFLLSNLYDFTPPAEAPLVPDCSLDAMMLHELDTLIENVARDYGEYQLHRAFRQLHDFCAVQVSTIYATAIKDRLYCDAADSTRRRQCQYVMYRMVDALTRMLAPMLVFTADEAWEYIPSEPGNQKLSSVHLAAFPVRRDFKPSEQTLKDWDQLRHVRDAATMKLDGLKKEKGMNKALDGELIFRVGDKSLEARLRAYGDDLEDLVGAGFHSFADGDSEKAFDVEVVDRRQEYKACARSWKRRPDVGQDAQYPDLSLRDAAVVRAAEQARG